jgi:beta-lactamase class A
MLKQVVASKKSLYWAVAVLACAGSFGFGWFLDKAMTVGTTAPPNPLRLTGYQYISPLITCNFGQVKMFSENQPIVKDLNAVVSQHEQAGDITNASVYFNDLTSGQWASVNSKDKYYPASLGKVPIMIAYYEMAESSSSLLEEEGSYPTGLPDLNLQQEIPPTNAITPGQNYTVEQLIEYMIKYSDNDAAATLTAMADQDNIASVYSDLQLPLTDNVTATTSDIMTVGQYATLFKTLYNATYLSRDFSERALQLMTETTFTQGLVAGVPSSTAVSHKYGLVSYTSNGVPEQWELHDCGIVYAPGHPYLLCVMTKGTTSIAAQEKTIADISSVAYKDVENGYQ